VQHRFFSICHLDANLPPPFFRAPGLDCRLSSGLFVPRVHIRRPLLESQCRLHQ
jgi:hypothetical protein